MNIKNKKNIIFNASIVFLLTTVFIFPAALTACKTESPGTGSEASAATGPLETVTSETVAGSEESKEQTIETQAEPTNQEVIQESIISGFNALLETDPTPDRLIGYIDANTEFATPETVAVMLEGLENLQKVYQGIYMEYLFEGDGQQKLIEAFTNEDEFIIENLDNIDDEILRDDIRKMFEGGFKFINLEGSFYPIIDFEYLKKYSGFLDQEYNDYLDVRAAESNEVYSRDAGLVISWDELAERMINSEKYLVKYPDETPGKIEVSKLFLEYFAAYIYGQNNTPTRDYTTNVVFDEVIQSYKKTIENNPGSTAVSLLKDFLDELEKNDFVLSDDILQGIDKYINSLIKSYELD